MASTEEEVLNWAFGYKVNQRVGKREQLAKEVFIAEEMSGLVQV